MELKFKYIRIDNLIPTEENAKEHDIGQLYELITGHGYRDPILANYKGKRYQIIAGHGRQKTLYFILDKILKDEIELPDGLQLKDDMLLVPVVYGTEMSEEEALGFVIDHNNSTMSGGQFTSLDFSRMYDRDKYIELLKKGITHSKTVDSDDLTFLIQIDQQKDEIKPEPVELFNEKGEVSFKATLIFSEEDFRDQFLDWIKDQQADFSGDCVLENIS